MRKSKEGIGFLLGFFFGILGLLGLLGCDTKEEKDEFVGAWVCGFIVFIVLASLLTTSILTGNNDYLLEKIRRFITK